MQKAKDRIKFLETEIIRLEQAKEKERIKSEVYRNMVYAAVKAVHDA